MVSLSLLYSASYLNLYHAPHRFVYSDALPLRLEAVPAFALYGAELERGELLACAVRDRTRYVVARSEWAHAGGRASEDEVARLCT